jgi:branched-chain amino acid transport system substrate-binding protein
VNVSARPRHTILPLVLVAAMGLWATGCGSSSSSSSSSASSSSGGSTGSQTASSTSSAAASTGLSTADKQWAISYAGATAGSATGAPVKIGYINQQGGPVAFLGATYGYDAVVKFLNQYASGIKGRPIQLDSCFVQSEEDGQRCAAQFITDHVPVIVTGQLVVGSASLYAGLKGKIPVIQMNPGTAPDLVSPNVYGMTSGALSLGGVGTFVTKNLHAKSVAVIYQNNPTGVLIAEKLLKPVLVAAGIKPTLVSFADTATTPDLVSALSSAGARTAQVLVSIISAAPCVSFAQAYKQLSLTGKVVTEADCYGKQNTAGVGGQWPNGWYFVGNQAYDPHIPNAASGVNTYVAMMNSAPGSSEWVYDTHATQSFAAAMLADKLLNQLGPSATPAQMTTALKAYKGPTALNTGNFDCGLAKTAPDVCTYNVNFVQSQNGGWLSAATGANAINVLTGK